MIITEILCKQSGIAERVSDKTEEIIILEKFVDKIRFNYSNSFPEKPPIRFQEKRFKKNVSFVSWSLARVYIVLKQENSPLIPLIPHLRVYH